MAQRKEIILVISGGSVFEDLEAAYQCLDALSFSRKIVGLIHFDMGGFDRLAESWAREASVETRVVSLTSKTASRLGEEIRSALLTAGSQAGLHALVPDDEACPRGAKGIIHRQVARVVASLGGEVSCWDLGEAATQKIRERDSLYRSIDINRDGLDFINIYSRAATSLGRALSNFTPCQALIDTPDGAFSSVEGYWYYLRSSPRHPMRERLRSLSGFQAKSLGREVCAQVALSAEERLPERLFRLQIKEAILSKLEKTPSLVDEVSATMMPFVHFYSFGPSGAERVVMGEAMWVIEFWDEIRNALSTS